MKAQEVINLFGGAYELADAIGVSHVSVYRWTYPRQRGGTAGYVPAFQIPRIIEAASQRGIKIRGYDA